MSKDKTADYYQPLFNLMSEHNLTLLEGELDEIIGCVNEMQTSQKLQEQSKEIEELTTKLKQESECVDFMKETTDNYEKEIENKNHTLENDVIHINQLTKEIEMMKGERWIRVEDSLPEHNQQILYSVTGENIRKGTFLSKDQWDRENMFCDGAFLDKSFISYWMPLPPKPIN